MTNWPTSTLDKVASVFNGKTPSKDEQRGEGHPVLKIRNVSELGLFRGQFESFVDPALAEKHATKKVRSGDTLVLNAAHNADYVASKTFRASPPTFGALATGEWLIVRPNERALDSGFTNHWINAAHTRAQLRELVNGIHLYPKDVARLRIPVPPLEEQRRIATILDQAETLRTQRRQALAHLDSLTQSLFLDMFGDPVANPKKWATQPLQKVCDPINDCPHSTPEWTESGVICLRTSNLTIGGWNWVDTRYVSDTTFHDRSKRGYLVAGDIVLSREGTVGIAAIVQAGMKLCMGQRLVQVRPMPSALEPEYLLRHLLYVLSPSRISQLMVGSTSQHLNVKELRALRIPIPSLTLQQTFATRIQAIEALKTSHRTALAQLDALFASLQQRAFAGEL